MLGFGSIEGGGGFVHFRDVFWETEYEGLKRHRVPPCLSEKYLNKSFFYKLRQSIDMYMAFFVFLCYNLCIQFKFILNIHIFFYFVQYVQLFCSTRFRYAI